MCRGRIQGQLGVLSWVGAGIKNIASLDDLMILGAQGLMYAGNITAGRWKIIINPGRWGQRPLQGYPLEINIGR